MLQLILHLLGDYVTQSDWMAQNKATSSKAAAAHAVVYTLPFLFLDPSWAAFVVILVTHFFIDRFRLVRYVVWAKNIILSPDWFYQLTARPDELGRVRPGNRLCWMNCTATGYPSDVPPWLAVWLMIAADNTLHLAINYAALRWL